jgi:hypothetical protein
MLDKPLTEQLQALHTQVEQRFLGLILNELFTDARRRWQTADDHDCPLP